MRLKKIGNKKLIHTFNLFIKKFKITRLVYIQRQTKYF